MLPDDQLRYVASMVAIIPLGFLYFLLFVKNQKLPRAMAHVFSILVSLALLSYCLGPWAFLYSAGSALVTYLLLAFLPMSIAHWVVFVWLMGFISVSHIYRMWN